MSPKDLYRSLSDKQMSIPLFSRPWWLDATAGAEHWDVVVVEDDGTLLAAMPFVRKQRYGFKLLGQPILTQHLGPWLRPDDSGQPPSLAKQKDLFGELIDQLPPFDHFAQNWSYTQLNWLPFFWKGFRQTTRYTYRLKDIDSQSLWKGLQANIRSDVKKAQNRFGLTICNDSSIEEFHAINSLTFGRQKLDIPYSLQQLRTLDAACVQRDCRRMFVAKDGQGRAHAAAYIVWDAHSAYYIMGGGDPKLRNSGAGSLCMWEAIQFSASVAPQFDFEGSMIEPVERFFRAFGATQTPYFAVSKTPSPLLKTALFAKDLVRP